MQDKYGKPLAIGDAVMVEEPICFTRVADIGRSDMLGEGYGVNVRCRRCGSRKWALVQRDDGRVAASGCIITKLDGDIEHEHEHVEDEVEA